jgi:hypothetical protein
MPEIIAMSVTSLTATDEDAWPARDGVALRLHAARKRAAPVLEAEAPWETHDQDGRDIHRRIYIYGTVLRDPDTGGFRMWYNRAMDAVLMATSPDGVTWTRPALGLESFQGSMANNLLPIRLHSPSVVVDPLAEPAERYRMLGYGAVAGGPSGYCTAHSPDGLRWSFYERQPALPFADTCTLARDPATGEFLAFHKRTHEHRGYKRRLVYVAASPDMRMWSEPVLALAPDEKDDEQTLAEGGISSQFYNLSAFWYASHWLGLATHFRFRKRLDSNTPGQSRDDGPIDVQLVRSRDGRTWRRFEDRAPVIANGPHEYDLGCILGLANLPVVAGDEMWMYYTAINTTHGGALPEKQVSIARAAWRLDGWASWHAGSTGGWLETRPMSAAGQCLLVNAAARSGEIRVGLRNAEGRPLPGYTESDCVPIIGDGVRQPVRWKGGPTLPPEGLVSLRVMMRGANLFALRFRAG